MTVFYSKKSIKMYSYPKIVTNEHNCSKKQTNKPPPHPPPYIEKGQKWPKQYFKFPTSLFSTVHVVMNANKQLLCCSTLVDNANMAATNDLCYGKQIKKKSHELWPQWAMQIKAAVSIYIPVKL